MALLKKIEFSDDDKMIIAGDYIDRGPDSDKMLDFICEHSDDPRFIFLKGNHDMEFVGYVDLLMRIVSKDEDGSILEDKEYVKDIYKRAYTTYVRELGFSLFDYYGTIENLINEKHTTINQLKNWASTIKKLKYVHRDTINGKEYIMVHAGYVDRLDEHDFEGSYDSIEEFYIYSRDDAYFSGGVSHSTIIAGHTPTILKEELTYNDGQVYTFCDEETDCTFYDIDCGGVYGYPNSNFVTIRLEDEQLLYLK